MGIFDRLAEVMVTEYGKEGRTISFELAKLAVQVKNYDDTILLMVNDPEYSVEKMAALLHISVRFVETSMADMV
ncbi:MAG TPA: hypothetical protein VNS58_27365 [Puia sp.]|nr:hypothetical protein [Puia sp.]